MGEHHDVALEPRRLLKHAFERQPRMRRQVGRLDDFAERRLVHLQRIDQIHRGGRQTKRQAARGGLLTEGQERRAEHQAHVAPGPHALI